MPQYPRHWQQTAPAQTTALPQVNPDGPGMTWQGLYDFVKSLSYDQLVSMGESARKITHDVGTNLGVSRGVRPEYEANWGDALNLGMAAAPLMKTARFPMFHGTNRAGYESIVKGGYFDAREGLTRNLTEDLRDAMSYGRQKMKPGTDDFYIVVESPVSSGRVPVKDLRFHRYDREGNLK